MRRWACVMVACLIGSGMALFGASPAGAAPAWTIVASPNPASPPSGAFASVSCATATDCFAVGGRGGLTLAERWNGTTWSVMVSPNVPGASTNELTGVSCVSSASCFAVGSAVVASVSQTLVEAWNGTNWQIDTSPNPSGSTGSSLSSVSCTSTASCFAVGSSSNSTTTIALTEQWDGTSWQIFAGPNPDSAAVLAGVSCTSPTSCLAVGKFAVVSGTDAGDTTDALSARWNGTSWSMVPNDAPPLDALDDPPNFEFSGVSCTSAFNCFAVGSYSISTSGGVVWLTLAERWNGSKFVYGDTPNATDAADNELAAVSCPSATSCTAVGSKFGSGSASHKTLSERWDGTSWSVVTTPNPAASDPTLAGVSCSGTTSCLAVGSAVFGPVDKTISETWNGTAWSMRTSLDAPGATLAELASTACITSANCFAVGDGGETALIEHFNGSAWSVAASPKPAAGVLLALSCPTATSCFAVGDYASAGTTKTLVEHWNGKAWSVQTSPNRTGNSVSILRGVSCRSATSCLAVGEVATGSNPLTLAERWNGKAWSIVASPNPGNVVNAVLRAVVCNTVTSCLAVGSFESGVTTKTLAERWNGSTWQIVGSPNRTGAQSTILSGVACVSAANCFAVGLGAISGTPASFALRWNGAAWTGSASGGPAGSSAAELAGVSCTSAGTCVAVGDAVVAGLTTTFADNWTGTKWQVVGTPNPSGARASSLAGVSCVAGLKCAAVGRWETGPHQRTLAERLP